MSAGLMSTDRHTRGRGLLRGTVTESNRTATRKLMKQGNAICVAVPVPFLHAMGIFGGEYVELIFDAEWDGFFVRALRSRPWRPETPPPPRSAEGQQ